MTTAEKIEHLIKKYKPFITSFEKIGNNLASGIVEEFIKDIKSLQEPTEEREEFDHLGCDHASGICFE